MTFAIYTRATEGMQDSATAALEEDLFLNRLLTRLCQRAPAALPGSFFLRHLQDFYKWRDPDSNRGHHDFQLYSDALRYADSPQS